MSRLFTLRVCIHLLFIFLCFVQCAHSPEEAQIDEAAIDQHAIQSSQQSSLEKFKKAFPETISIDPDNIHELESYKFNLKFKCTPDAIQVLRTEYEKEKQDILKDLHGGGYEFSKYKEQRKSYLSALENDSAFIGLLLDYLKLKFSYRGPYYGCRSHIAPFIKAQELTRYLEYLHVSVSAVTTPEKANSITISFAYSYINPAKGENLDYGQDRIIITIKGEGQDALLIVTVEQNENVMQVIDATTCRRYVENLVVRDFPDYNICFRNFNILYNEIQMARSELSRWIMNSKKMLDKRLGLISEINIQGIYCYLIYKNIALFEILRDVTVRNVHVQSYKDDIFLYFELTYLNVFNNINIKFNDQYKIALYLFDNVVRKGIRTFEDVFELGQVNGIAFEILATDRNFVKDSDVGAIAKYQFYLMQDSIATYIQDEITGKELADKSYILFDGERIDLLTF